MLNKKYQSESSVIASYDYTDIANGTGMVVFNGLKYTFSGSDVYGLTQYTPYSEEIEGGFNGHGTGNYILYTYNFDLTKFNNPRRIGGMGIIEVSFSLTNSNTTYDCYIYPKIQVYDGSTATTIGSVSSPVKSFGSGVNGKWHWTLPVEISDTLFKKDEILRLKFDCYGRRPNVGGLTGSFSFGHDPQNRKGATIDPATDLIPTKLEFHCPFKIDI